MPPLPRPHRVTFLPPIMTLVQGEPRGRVFAELLSHVVFGHLASHPVVAMTEPDDRVFVDGNGFPLDANHPELGNLLAWEFGTARRDEVLWLELTLVPGASAMPRLHSRGADGSGGVHIGGGGTFGGGLAGALAAWLAARFLPPGPELEPFAAADVRATVDWIDRMLAQLHDVDRDATILTSPPIDAIAVAALRTVAQLAPAAAGADLVAEIDGMILESDDDDPIAARNGIVRRMLGDLASTRGDARRLCAAAPQRGKSHMLLYGEDLGVDDEVRHQSIAATLLPENPSALHNYAAALLRAGRPEESRRAAARALAVAPRYVSAHNDVVRALRAAERPGAAFAAAQASWNLLG